MNNTIYNIDEIKNIISPIAREYGAKRVYLFGSYARGEANEQSDIDLRIDKGDIKGFVKLSGLRLDIISKLDKNVDLLTTGSLDSVFLESIIDEEILLYGEE